MEFVSGTEYYCFLQDKLHEELTELADSKFKDVDEYADVIEVLITLAEYHGVSKVDIEARRIEKLYERGGFKKGLVLNRGNTK